MESNLKILLIETSRTYHEKSKGVRLSLPLGLLYMGSVLEQEGFQVSVFNCLVSAKTRVKEIPGFLHHGVDDDYFKKIISEESPDIIGISCPFTAQFDNFVHAAKLAKEVLPDVLLVGGGPHFSVCGEDFLYKNPYVDCYISGEGEDPMLALVKAFDEGAPLDGIPGITHRSKDENGKTIIKKIPHVLMRDMDNIPLPAYHLIDMEMFFQYQLYGCEGYEVPISARLDQGGKKTISMITSRGCPFKCTFCSIALHMGKPVRAHSPEYVVSHIDKVVNEYGVEHIFFEDDNLTFKMKRTQETCERMIEKNINITWSTPNGVRADKLTKDLLALMKESGCAGLIVGTESGDQDTLDNIIKKDLKLDTVVRVARWCKELDIELTSFFIIGFPKETKQKIQNTIDFAVDLYKHYRVTPLLNVATPLIGTPLHDIVVRDQLLVGDLTPHNLSGATQPLHGGGMITTDDFNPGDLQDFAKQLDDRLSEINPNFNVAYHT